MPLIHATDHGQNKEECETALSKSRESDTIHDVSPPYYGFALEQE